jgi:hypothetical protein
MSKMKDIMGKRKRRRANHALKNPASVRRHNKIAGRTGTIKSKRTPSSQIVELKEHTPNKEMSKSL